MFVCSQFKRRWHLAQNLFRSAELECPLSSFLVTDYWQGNLYFALKRFFFFFKSSTSIWRCYFSLPNPIKENCVCINSMHFRNSKHYLVQDTCKRWFVWIIYHYEINNFGHASRPKPKRSDNFEISFWCLQFPPKNQRKQVYLKFHSSKVEFLYSFFWRKCRLEKIISTLSDLYPPFIFSFRPST